MNIKLIPLFLFLPLLPLSSQELGIAVEDGITAPLTNPAAMGVGNASGIGYTQSYSDGEIQDRYDLTFSLGKLAYCYSRDPEESVQLIAGGVPILPGLYGGVSYLWADQNRLGLSLLYRPYSFLSLAARGDDLTGDPSFLWGAGIRPFLFLPDPFKYLTLSADSRIDREEQALLQAEVSLSPFRGMEISGSYNFQEQIIQAGLSFSLGQLTSGTRNRGDDFRSGEFFINASFKDSEGILDGGKQKAIIYDTARVILDVPGNGCNLSSASRGEISLMDFIREMEEIKRDRSVKALIFHNQEFRTSFANLQEIEILLREVKASGKKIYFYYDSFETFSYLLASSLGDRVYLNPAGMVNLRGFVATRVYLKDFLASCGIRFQNYRSHPYKTTYNNLSESSMTEEERESLTSLMMDLDRELLRMLGEGRNSKFILSPEEILQTGPFLYADRALELGMVDELLYEDQFWEILNREKLKTSPASRRQNRINREWEGGIKPRIALIYAEGTIQNGEGIAGKSIGADSLARAIRTARTNPLIRAIVLRINSGGGSALASDMIEREVALCGCGEAPKPVIISMGGVAASGGYYIAAPASLILASPGTLTGSIGVISLFPDLSGLLEKFDITAQAVKSSDSADLGNILRPLSEEEDQRVSEYVVSTYQRFIRLVGESRGMREEEVHVQAQGRVWSGSQALDRGLIDRIGGLSDAVAIAGQTGGAGKDVRVVEIVPGRNPGLLERLVPALGRPAASTEIFPDPFKEILEFYRSLEEYGEGEALYLMPYTGKELGIAP